MKAYRSRMAAVTRVRTLREELARAALANAVAESLRAGAECERRALGRAELQPVSSVSLDALRASLERSQLAAGSEAWARSLAQRAAEAENAARGAWSEAATKLKAIEVYEQRRREEHLRVERRAATYVMDEIAAGTVARRRSR
ncbi:MAG: hypothetical protein M0Z87_02925 [Actinomycetota bacterium]|nr:hypothetical protein [Actinomycetota bacterium]